MRHLLMDPAFPDIVAEWAEEEARARYEPAEWANDNELKPEELADPFLPLLIRAEIDATRIW